MVSKSRNKWIEDGDMNTKYYNSKTFIRQRKNKILAPSNDDASWEEDPDTLQNIVKDYFTNFFHDDVTVSHT